MASSEMPSSEVGASVVSVVVVSAAGVSVVASEFPPQDAKKATVTLAMMNVYFFYILPVISS